MNKNRKKISEVQTPVGNQGVSYCYGRTGNLKTLGRKGWSHPPNLYQTGDTDGGEKNHQQCSQ